ncbi:MAG TPA: cobyrinate a,c-diamide synthase [Candidatus Binataceae bacterium]
MPNSESQIRRIPRLLIAATGSGAGKTTATIGLIAALRARGLTVAAFKCGPDYLDPTYHARVSGGVSHNLDGWMMGREAVTATFARAARNADIAVIEGMMGLFDGASPVADEGSSAEIAKWLSAPVVLVTDASGMARTVAAVAHGFAHFDSALNLAGLICNRIGSRGHLDLLRAASREVPVLGGLPERAADAFPERHLGLFSADEKHVPSTLLDEWGRLAAEWFDLDAIIAVARSAPSLELTAGAAEMRSSSSTPRCRLGVALDDAFHFYYEDNLRRLEALGAEIVNFSPVRDRELPEVDGLYFGGGYPEALAPELSGNHAMLEAVRAFASRGGPIYAECGGLMYLARSIRTLDGTTYPMAGLIDADALMHDRLQAIGYVEVETVAPSILGSPGLRFRGHQFRYSTLEPEPGDVERTYTVRPKWGGEFTEGYRRGNLLASYVHAHWASNPAAAAGLVESCTQFRACNR